MNPELPLLPVPEVKFMKKDEEVEKVNKVKKVNKVNKVKKVTKVTKVTVSTFSTKVPYLIIKNPKSETAGQFKYLSKLLNLKHHELLDLILAAFVENNPELEDRLTNQTVRFKALPENNGDFKLRSKEADKILAEAQECTKMMAAGMDKVFLCEKCGAELGDSDWACGQCGKRVLTRKVIAYEELLGSKKEYLIEFLKDKTIPAEQKQEIKEFLEGMR